MTPRKPLLDALVEALRPTDVLISCLGANARYLPHMTVPCPVFALCDSMGAAVPMHRVAFFLAYITGMLALSYVVYRFFEAPAQDFIRGRRRVAALPRPKVQADDPPGPVSGSPGRR